MNIDLINNDFKNKLKQVVDVDLRNELWRLYNLAISEYYRIGIDQQQENKCHTP